MAGVTRIEAVFGFGIALRWYGRFQIGDGVVGDAGPLCFRNLGKQAVVVVICATAHAGKGSKRKEKDCGMERGGTLHDRFLARRFRRQARERG